MSDAYEGRADRECGEHRPTIDRAWCFDCTEWCYPEPGPPCARCELPLLRAGLAAAEARGREQGRWEAVEVLKDEATKIKALGGSDEPLLSAADLLADFLESTGGQP